MAEELTNMALINLPDNVLNNILTYLHPPSAYQVGYSCKSLLRKVFAMANLFEIVRIPFNMSDKELEYFLVRCNAKERTKSIDLSYSRHVTGSGLGPLLGSSMVEFMDLRSMPCLSYTGVLPVLRSMNSLWSFDCSVKHDREDQARNEVTLPEGYLDVWNLRGEVFCRKAAQEDSWQCMQCQSSDVVARCHKKDCTTMVCQAHIAKEGALCPDCKTWVCKASRFCSGCFACEKCRMGTEKCGNCGDRLCYKCYTRCQDCGHIECGCETLRCCICCGCTPLAYNGKVKDYGSIPVPILSIWQARKTGSRDTLQVHGRVTGHPSFTDAEIVSSSNVVAGNLATGFEITTGSGSRYFLGRKA